MKPHAISRRWILAALLLVFSGCQTARMAIPSGLSANADTFPCLGRGGFSLSEKFSFGPYQVTDVHRGWTHRVSWGIIMYENSRARQQYEFSLQTPAGRTWQGQAATGVRQEELKGMVAGGELTLGLDRSVLYVARLGLAAQSNAWTLVLAEERGNVVLKGLLADGTTTYRVEGTRQLAGTSMPLMENAGFLIYAGTQVVAAVDLLNAGSVHFARDLSTARREPLAAAAVALLLYRDISRE